MTNTDNNKLQGLGGWLILVGIGVVTGPIRLLITYLPLATEIFGEGTWEALTTADSDAYVPYFSYLLVGEIIVNTLVLAVSIYLVYLFFTKHYLFPKLYIGVSVASLILIPLDAWLVSIVLPEVPMFDSATTTEFARAIVVAAIWIPYMLVSKRVRVTFVKGQSDNKMQPNAETAV